MTQFWPIEPESNPAWGALKKGLLDSEEDSHEKNHLSSFGLCHLWTCLELLYPSCYKPEEEANRRDRNNRGIPEIWNQNPNSASRPASGLLVT